MRRLSKEYLKQKLEINTASFIAREVDKKNLPKEIKEVIHIAQQDIRKQGLSAEYPIILKQTVTINTFIEFIGFAFVKNDFVRNANNDIVSRIRIAYVGDLDYDEYRLEHLIDEEFIFLYVSPIL